MKHGILFLSFVVMICSCQKEESVVNNFNDTLLVKLADFQDRRSGDSLLTYLKHPDSKYRLAATLAFASLQDSNYVAPLKHVVLNDPDRNVRQAAAYALGQTISSSSEHVIMKASKIEKEEFVLTELIEAYGKVARKWRLNIHPGDSALASALAWSYYRMALRGLSDQTLNSKAIELLVSSRMSTRLGAAHYFARGAKDYSNHGYVLIQTAKHDKSSEVRMAAALALRKIKSDSSRHAAEYCIRNDPDYRVRINAIRAVQDFAFDQTKNILLEALQDSAVNVAIAASETIKSSITKEHGQEVIAAARTCKHWRIRANLYEAALSVADRQDLAEEIKTAYDTSTNSYGQAALLTALQHSVMSYGFVREQLLKSKVPVVKVSAASSLVGMNYGKNFDAALKPQFAKLYQEAIGDGDAAVIGIITGALADSTLNYKSVIKDHSFLNDARKNLSLPKDFEAILPLETAIAYFEGRKISSTLENEFNHPIPWGIVRRISSDQKALIKTSKGDITIRLFVDQAPGSVANFVSLVLNKYYDGKFFHRVVPNFVVQGGCPRGDGWGSEAYSIRSEFSPLRYKTGAIGMASAGKDTEGTQWFITHSPTPHLEGRYTLFAAVEYGMDVVHEIEVGDRIITVEIIDLKPL